MPTEIEDFLKNYNNVSTVYNNLWDAFDKVNREKSITLNTYMDWVINKDINKTNFQLKNTENYQQMKEQTRK